MLKVNALRGIFFNFNVANFRKNINYGTGCHVKRVLKRDS